MVFDWILSNSADKINKKKLTTRFLALPFFARPSTTIHDESSNYKDPTTKPWKKSRKGVYAKANWEDKPNSPLPFDQRHRVEVETQMEED